MLSKALSNKLYYTTFLLAVFVLVLHSSYVDVLDPALAGYEFSYSIQRVFLVIGDAAVPTFFAISGYLLFTKFTLRGYPKMLLGKVFSLVIPYFVWSVLAFLLMQVFFPLFNGEPITLTFQSVVVDILMANSYPHLWFVRPLLVYFVCSPLLYFAFKYLRKWSIFIPVILLFVYMFFRPEYGGILLFIPLFFIGSYLAYFQIPIMNRYRPRLISVAVLAVLISLSLTFTFIHAQFEDYAYYVYRFAAPVLVWFSMDALTSLFEKENIHDIFKTSAFIFFCHLGIVNGFKLLLQMGLPADSNYNCAALFFCVITVSSVATLAITYLLQRFAKPVYRFLGGR
ncbi:MAG: acyltransferase [Erysipelotrichaceae bacterium]|nr:acyltransferase [Erysipelotrichaceae bacterium]